jgi:hypothetical protein
MIFDHSARIVETRDDSGHSGHVNEYGTKVVPSSVPSQQTVGTCIGTQLDQ